MKKLGLLSKCLIFAMLLQMSSVAVVAERLPVKIYTSADGLGSGFVNYAMRDSRGFMWFCTRDGLSRFDGSRFVNYTVGRDAVAPGIETIYESRDGSFWISTTGGTFRVDPNEVTPSDTTAPRLAAEFVMSGRGQFFEDDLGNLWSNVHGFSRYSLKDGKPVFEKVELDLPPRAGGGFYTSDFAKAADGSLWLNTSWGLVRRLTDGRLVYYPVDYGGRYGNPSMMADRDGRIWLAGADRVLVFKPESVDSLPALDRMITRPFEVSSTFELKRDQPHPLPSASGELVEFTNQDLSRFVEYSYAKRIFQTSDGDVWITAEDYLLQFAKGVYRMRTGAEGLPNVMARMAEDAAGNLWIAGQTGLARLDRNGLVTFGKQDGANSDRFFAITEDTEGTVYFAGRDYYISRFKDGKLETVRPAIDPNSNYLWTSRFVMRASDGDWWILTSNKLYRFSSTPDFASLNGQPPSRTYTREDGLKGDSMFQIFEDSAGNIWVSTRTDDDRSETGIAVLRRGEDKFQSFSDREGLPDGHAFSSAVQDAGGNIWFSIYSGGLARYSNDRFELFDDKIAGIPSNTLPDLHLDKKNRLWVASANGGLIRVDDPTAAAPTFVPITTANGLSSNNVRTITEDNFGRIYAGSARGVDRLSPDTGFIKHYTVNDGLPADFVVDSHLDQAGNVWFATNKGVSRLVPLPDEKIVPPQIFLGGLQIAGEQQAISQLGAAEIDKGELSATQNNLQFDFFGLDFRAGESLRYQYMLEGADTDWSQPSELHTVTFANLQPASYRFMVRAVNSEGAVSLSPASVRFTILPPVYLRWWFILLCGLVLLGAVILTERYRAARHRELALSEERFRSLVEQSPFGILILAPDGSIRSVNQAYLDIWGRDVTREQILQWDIKGDSQLVQAGVVDQIGRAFQGETVKGNPVLYDFRRSSLSIPDADGSTRSAWLVGSVYPVKDLNGDLLEVIAVIEDITAQKTAEEQLARARLERLIELEQVRGRIATDLHDDIGASLTQIAILSEVARQRTIASADRDANTEPLSMIYNVSNELVGTMSDIVWAINPQKDQLHDLTLRMRRFASDVLTAKEIDLEFRAPEDIEDLSLNSNLRREVFLIFKEAINNIVKHSDASEVEVDFEVLDDKIILTIVDNGKGFDPERSAADPNASLYASYKGGNGLSSMRRRASDSGGELSIVSSPGTGTKIVLLMPMTIRLGGDLSVLSN